MDVVIVKYNAGNILSVDLALKRLGVNALITGDADAIYRADKVIFPGVGEAGTTMKYLHEHQLDSVIASLKQPVLGICLGLQLLCSHSDESDTSCIGIFNEQVKKFEPSPGLKVPHMGWNKINHVNGPLLDASLEGRYVYFVHSYYATCGNNTAAVTEYTVPFSSVMAKDNFFAVQFHPEKSGATGEQILKNFLAL